MNVVSDTVKSFYQVLGVKTVTTEECPSKENESKTAENEPSSTKNDPFENFCENSDIDTLEKSEEEIEFITSDTLISDENGSYSDILIEVLANNRNASTQNFDLQDQFQNGAKSEIASESVEKSVNGASNVLQSDISNGRNHIQNGAKSKIISENVEKSINEASNVFENGLTKSKSVLEKEDLKPVQNGAISSDDTSEENTDTGAEI